MRVPGFARQLALGALALWLGLWPASDAVTGASRTVIVLTPAVAEQAPCCGKGPAPATTCAAAAASCRAASAAAPTAQACSDSEAACAKAKAACSGTKTARCGQCICTSGLVLFATASPRIDPQLDLVGTLCASSMIRLSRHLRPPLRPPMAGLPIAA